MNDKEATREECQLCLEDCSGSMEYGISLGEMDQEEYVDFEFKKVCARCFTKVKIYVLGMQHENYSSKLKQVSGRFLANPIEG